MVRWTRSVALPLLAFLVGISGCLPPQATTPAPLAEVETPSPQDRSGAMASGRVYVLGQVVAREQERSAELRQQLKQSAGEIERLRTEVAQLRQHESELRAELDKAVATTNGANVAGAGSSASAVAGPVSRGANTSGSSPGNTSGTNQSQVAAAEAQRCELDQQQATMVAHLRKAVAEEQQRREKAESELSRLKAETSTPPYAANSATAETELIAAKEQVAKLRADLDQERRARERVAQGFRALQEQQQQRLAAENDGVQNASAENSELRLQIEHLQQEKQGIAQSFKRSLAESQTRTVELEHELTLARSTNQVQPGAAGELAGVQAENAALRSRLDEEHRHTAELGAKLKMALRVTDLIFKMQAQQTASPAQQISPAGQP